MSLLKALDSEFTYHRASPSSGISAGAKGSSPGNEYLRVPGSRTLWSVTRGWRQQDKALATGTILEDLQTYACVLFTFDNSPSNSDVVCRDLPRIVRQSERRRSSRRLSVLRDVASQKKAALTELHTTALDPSEDRLANMARAEGHIARRRATFRTLNHLPLNTPT